MTSRNNTGAPSMPSPPRSGEYSYRWALDVVRTWDTFRQIFLNPGEGRATNIVLTNLPSNTDGLEAGALWSNAGAVYVVESNKPSVSGQSVTVSQGSVSVSTS